MKPNPMEEINIRGKPKGIFKFFTRIPAYLYRLGLTKPLEATTMVLTTKTRKSKKTVKIPLGYARKGNIVYAASVYQYSDWYQNALKNPEVKIQIGKEHLKARAYKVDDLEEKAEAYRVIIRTQGEKGAEKYYYVKPGASNEEIGELGKTLPIMRFEIV